MTTATTRQELSQMVRRYNISQSMKVRAAIETYFRANNNIVTVDGLTYQFNGINHIGLIASK